MALGARIKLARQARKMTQQELADAIKWEQGAIGNVERRDSKSCSHTAAIADALNVDLNWLSTGKGQMEVSGDEAVINNRPEKDYTMIPIFTNDELIANRSIKISANDMRPKSYVLTDHIIAVGAAPDAVIEATMDSNNMQPTIADKSYIRIDTSKAVLPIREGKIYAFIINNDLKIKRLFKSATGDIIIRSDNDMYKDEVISYADWERLATIIGWVFDWPPNENW